MLIPASRDHDSRILQSSSNLGAWIGICGQVVATVYNMVTEIYHELLFSELQASLFADTQEKVDGSLAAASGTALEKTERISDRLRDGDPESVGQALTTCRRLIDSSADYAFPARDERGKIGSEVDLKVGPQQVLNRLQAHTPTPAGRPRTAGTVYVGPCPISTPGAPQALTPRSPLMRPASFSFRPTSRSARSWP